LRKLEINLENDEERVRILESIQWTHIRELEIIMKQRGFETRVMKALIDGAKEVSGRVELEGFYFHIKKDSNGSLAMPEGELLQAFLSSTPLKKLLLEADFTLEQTLSMLKSTDFSRMQRLDLCTQGFSSAELDSVLECLQHARELRVIELWQANITAEQKNLMMGKGITLSKRWNMQA
jgi:hypothetical protein